MVAPDKQSPSGRSRDWENLPRGERWVKEACRQQQDKGDG